MYLYLLIYNIYIYYAKSMLSFISINSLSDMKISVVQLHIFIYIIFFSYFTGIFTRMEIYIR